MMDKIFDKDFELVGKHMPYVVPDGFFDKLEQNVMEQINLETTTRKRPRKRLLRFVGPAAAAAVALLLVLTVSLPKHSTPSADFESVQLAYNNLSTEDQEFLQEIYNDDLFINFENEENDYEENH